MDDLPPRDDRWRFRVLVEGDAGELQRFFDANPEYFLSVDGEPAARDAAAHELVDVPPPGMPYREMLLFGVSDGDDPTGALVAMATVVGGFISEEVWHIGLFIVATSLHGSGAAHAIHRALERWMVERGARWVRLGVVAGNARAERFWERSGYLETRRRGPIAMGRKTNMLRVMVKPLAGGTVDEYLRLVERDRPSSP
jgi:RimJ/RimL family protein N-acetyltransferase